jgi:acetyl-CoA carboxylase carboxyl transferase subunit alpha
MLEHSFFFGNLPRGLRGHLWKDASRAREAARSLRLTARDLLEAGFADEIVAEPAEFTVERADRYSPNSKRA